MRRPLFPRFPRTSLATAALLALAASLCSSTGLEPPRQGQRTFEADIGVELPRSVRTRKPYCLESTARWPFRIVLRNLPDVPFNATDGVVTVDGSDGQTRFAVVGPQGTAVIEWPMQQDGVFELSVRAQVGDSTSPTEHFTVEVIPCYWEFSIWFEEEYDLSEDESITVAARASAMGGLGVVRQEGEPGATQGVLELRRAGGSFSLSASDTLEPLDVRLDPPVEGSIDIQLERGRAGGGQVYLSLIGTASGLPDMTHLAFEDVTEQGNEIDVTAPIPTSASIPGRYDGSGFDPILRMMLNSVTLPDTGGVMETNPDMVFIQSSDRIRSSATFTLWRSREIEQR